MKKKAFSLTIALVLILAFSLASFSQMQSDNYRITSSVISAGGGPTTSDNFKNDSTMGQSSPLMQGDQNPSSDNYNSYPGFWYTVGVEPADLCECDLNIDTKCDMQDWLVFGQDWGRIDCNDPGVEECECDITEDGKCDMQDWLVFGDDWGRTDCP
jgi:hypothetical protein